jgi:hypothetical protein
VPTWAKWIPIVLIAAAVGLLLAILIPLEADEPEDVPTLIVTATVTSGGSGTVTATP